MQRLTPAEAERTRHLIEWVFLIGMYAAGIPALLLASTAPTSFATVAVALAVALLVFEATIFTLAHWWFG